MIISKVKLIWWPVYPFSVLLTFYSNFPELIKSKVWVSWALLSGEMLLLLKQCGGGGVRYQRCSWLVRDWTLTCRLQATQLRALHQTPLNKCNSVQKFKLDLQASEQKDHLLYVAQSTRYYTLMNLFAITQFVLWSGLSYSMLEMKTVEVPQKTKQDETLPWWRKYDLSYYKRPMSIAAFIIGKLYIYWLICATTCIDSAMLGISLLSLNNVHKTSKHSHVPQLEGGRQHDKTHLQFLTLTGTIICHSRWICPPTLV